MSARKTTVQKGAKAPKPGNADPAFAIIAEAKGSIEAHSRLYDVLDRAEIRALKKHGRRPFGLIAWRNYAAICGSEIDGRREEFLRKPRADRAQIEREYRDAKRRERAAARTQIEWDRRAGLTQQRQELGRAFNAMFRAIWRAAKARPTTPAGAAALLDYIKADMELGSNDWHLPAIASVATALKSWRGPR